MEKIWLKNYPKGVPATIDVDHRTLNNLFDEACQKYPDNRAVTCNDVTITFTQLQKYVNNFAASLAELGVKKHDRVAVIMPNIMQYPIAVFAILKLGASVVNINPLYTAAEIDYLLENSGAKVVIVLDMMAHKLNELHNKYGVQHVVVAKVPDLYPTLKRIIINLALKYFAKIDLSYTYKAHNFRDLAITDKSLPDKVHHWV